MFLEILFFILLGLLLGTITGLIPGLHPNNLFVIILAAAPFLTSLPLHSILAFVVSLSVSNTFIDFIPSIFFGAPEEDSVLSVLPGHRMLLEGRGYEALFLATTGGLMVIMLTVITLPVLITSVPFLYYAIKPVIHFILAAIVLWMIVTEKKKFAAISVFLLAGVFGFMSLNSLPSDHALFPALTGLFAISTLITSIFSGVRIPAQRKTGEIRASWIRGGLTGWLAGLLAGLLPGIGSSQSGVIASQFFRVKRKEFIITLGGINTSNIFFTLIVFFLIGKTRSGASWFISQLFSLFTYNDLILIAIIGVITCFLSVLMTLRTGSFVMNRINERNYQRISKTTLVSLVVLIIIFSGLPGLLIALTGTMIGLLTIISGIKRTHMMGFLLFPTILYFSGMSPYLMNFLY